MRLNDNTICITGGSSGIGFALAKSFLELGNTVIICGRDQQKLEAVKQRYPRFHTICGDIAYPDELRKTADAIRKDFPELNILINNAGIQHRYDFSAEEHVLAKIDEELAVNLAALMKLTSLLLPVLTCRPEAAIMNVSSLLGFTPKKSAPVYCATKAAVHAFSKSLRYQLADTSVKVFEIVPPLVDTEMTRFQTEPKLSPEVLAREVIRSVQRDCYEIRVGRVKGALLLNRFFPALMESMVRNR